MIGLSNRFATQQNGPSQAGFKGGVRAGQAGFTLIELLVVIVIIALLTSILVPSLSRAKEVVRRVTCLSNLRNMGLATNAYHAEYRGFFPPALYGMYSPGPIFGWDFIRLEDGTYEPGLIWSSMESSVEILQCPSMRGDANWAGDPYTGYNYNTSYLGGPTEPLGGWELAGGMPPTANVEEILVPSLCVVFGDGSYGKGANKFMRSPWPGPRDTDISKPTRGAGCQGFLHLGQSNASFADGHAESFTTPYRETAPEALPWMPEAGGFLSPDNDLYDLK